LIIGKNNTGKSSLLEAIALLVTKCDLGILYQLLEERGELYKPTAGSKIAGDINLKMFSSFFTDRVVGFNQSNALAIGTLENTLPGKEVSSQNAVFLRFVKYFEEPALQNEEDGAKRKRIVLDEEVANRLGDFNLGLEIRSGMRSVILPLDFDRLFSRYVQRGLGNLENFQFIRTRSIDRDTNGKLWDSIILTDKERHVMDALKIIEPTVERVAFIDDGFKNRSAVIKLTNSASVFPLQSMGDGINRIFTMILALVNAENGFLLIDEFENGLHHSVQEKLWVIVFQLASKLNVQLFATTHSEDCIAGFEYGLTQVKHNIEGKLIRLENRNGKISQVEYSDQELKIALENHIETR
jgi:AAA15 family ATPase/GTPase